MSSIGRVLTNEELCRLCPRTFRLALLGSSFTPASVFPHTDAMQLLALRAVVGAAAVSRRQVCRLGSRTDEDVLAAAALERSSVSVLTFTPPHSHMVSFPSVRYYQLASFPGMSSAPIRAHYAAHRWNADPQRLRAWQRGETG